MSKEELRYLIEALPATILENEKYGVSEILISQSKVLAFVDQLDEPEKPAVPRFVAEWFENNKEGLTDAFVYRYTKYPKTPTDERDSIDNWFANTDNVMEILIKMKSGYTVEEEKKYRIKIGNVYYKKNFEFTLWSGKALVFNNKEQAMTEAKQLGGTIEEVNP